MSLLTDMSTYLAMSDTSDTVHVMYGITLVPSPFQMKKGQQVIAFFDKHRAEVPSTLWVEPELMIKMAFMKIPIIKHIQEFKSIDQDIILAPPDNNWSIVRLLTVAPFPNQWADQLRNNPLTPIELAYKLDSELRSWNPTVIAKMKPLQDWMHTACVREKPNDQQAGSVLKLP